MYNVINNMKTHSIKWIIPFIWELRGGLNMSQLERNYKMEHLLEKNKFNKEVVFNMTDEQIEYFHWLYFEESVYDLM